MMVRPTRHSYWTGLRQSPTLFVEGAYVNSREVRINGHFFEYIINQVFAEESADTREQSCSHLDER